jgi:hypothetical protein
MERCGTHSAVNIIRQACNVPHHVAHEEQPFLCKEAKLLFEGKDFRTKDLRKKVQRLREHHKSDSLVCEANHRFGYFTTFLVQQFPGCKILFLYRDPIATIISRISIWSHYPEFLQMYPEFYKQKISELQPPHDFNKYRISPPKNYSLKSVVDLYLWEWIENYKFVRKELNCIPVDNRFVMMTDHLTPNFDRLLGFIGWQFFKVDGEVLGWARVKSDSVYVQPKQEETDVFVTRNRDASQDETIQFAHEVVKMNRDRIISSILSMLSELNRDVDGDILEMDKEIGQFLKIKMA